jgi:hypothetical protein
MYSQKGNLAFMGTVGTAAVLSATAVAVLGLTELSLAILIILTVGSVLLGKWFENRIEAKEEDAFYSQFEQDDE